MIDFGPGEGLGITVITMYRGYDAEMFVRVIQGNLTEDEVDEWRKSHKCDEYHCDNDDTCDDHNNMFFRKLRVRSPATGTCDLVNVDGDMHG